MPPGPLASARKHAIEDGAPAIRWGSPTPGYRLQTHGKSLRPGVRRRPGGVAAIQRSGGVRSARLAHLHVAARRLGPRARAARRRQHVGEGQRADSARRDRRSPLHQGQRVGPRDDGASGPSGGAPRGAARAAQARSFERRGDGRRHPLEPHRPGRAEPQHRDAPPRVDPGALRGPHARRRHPGARRPARRAQDLHAALRQGARLGALRDAGLRARQAVRPSVRRGGRAWAARAHRAREARAHHVGRDGPGELRANDRRRFARRALCRRPQHDGRALGSHARRRAGDRGSTAPAWRARETGERRPRARPRRPGARDAVDAHLPRATGRGGARGCAAASRRTTSSARSRRRSSSRSRCSPTPRSSRRSSRRP